MQEVLAQVARPDCAAPDRPAELFAWALVAVRRTNARLVRELLAQAHEPLAELPDGSSRDLADEIVERNEAVDRLRGALARVAPGRSRRIAALHAFAYGRDEIAALVGATPREVRRAVERFQLALAQEARGRRAVTRYDGWSRRFLPASGRPVASAVASEIARRSSGSRLWMSVLPVQRGMIDASARSAERKRVAASARSASLASP